MRNELSDQDRKRRRRRRRIQVIIIYTAIAIGLAWFFESQATTTIIFVRHAEKAAAPADEIDRVDGLSPAANPQRSRGAFPFYLRAPVDPAGLPIDPPDRHNAVHGIVGGILHPVIPVQRSA